MGIPNYEQIMRPFLNAVSDCNTHTIAEIREKLSKEFNLTDEEKNELLPSGKQSMFHNRVAWAKTYLLHANLLGSPERGKVRITDRGNALLRNYPLAISSKDLLQFEEFREFKNRQTQAIRRDPVSEVVDEPPQESVTNETPQELIERNIVELNANLASDLLETIMQLSPQFFESLVVDLLVAMGYGGSRKDAGSVIGRSHDGGIDGLIKQDSLGLDVVYIQAKRWENTVGSPDVQKFVGSLAGKKAQRGVMLTTSTFSKEAEKYVETIGARVILIDGSTLTDLMIEHGVGVSTVQTFAIKKIDNDFFTED